MRGSTLPILLLTLGVFLGGCTTTPTGDRRWTLQWGVEVHERTIAGDQWSLVRRPHLEGAEIWWVDGDQVLIESYGNDAARERGASRTWIRPGADQVYEVNLRHGEFRAVPFSRWVEERLRSQRASMIETVRMRATSGEPESLAAFVGDFETRRHHDQRGREWTSLTALPGRVWRFYGTSPQTAVWRNRWIPLAFDGVVPDQAHRIHEFLRAHTPRTVEELAIPLSGKTLVVRRHLRRVSALRASERFPEPSPRDVARVDERRAERRDFDLLWGYFADEEKRPEDLDLRGVRFLLADVVNDSHVEAIHARAANTSDLEELEELWHLLFGIHPDRFDEWWIAASAQGDLAQLLAQASVLSLRAPQRLEGRIAPILGEADWWSGLPAADAAEARSWFQGVDEWIQVRPGVSSGD